MKHLFLFAGAAVAVALLVLFTAFRRIDLPKIKSKIEAAGRSATGRKVSIGSIQLGLDLRVSLKSLTLFSLGGQNSILQVSETRLKVSPLGLLKGQIVPQDVTLLGLKVTARNAVEFADLIPALKGGLGAVRSLGNVGDMSVDVENGVVEVNPAPLAAVPTVRLTEVRGRLMTAGELRFALKGALAGLHGTASGGQTKQASEFELSGAVEPSSWDGQVCLRLPGISTLALGQLLQGVWTLPRSDTGTVDLDTVVDLVKGLPSLSRAHIVSKDVSLSGSKGKICGLSGEFTFSKGELAITDLTLRSEGIRGPNESKDGVKIGVPHAILQLKDGRLTCPHFPMSVSGIEPWAQSTASDRSIGQSPETSGQASGAPAGSESPTTSSSAEISTTSDPRRTRATFEASFWLEGTPGDPRFAARLVPKGGKIRISSAPSGAESELLPGGEVTIRDDRVELAGVSVRLGTGVITVNGAITNAEGPGALTLDVTGDRLDLDRLVSGRSEAIRRSVRSLGVQTGPKFRAKIDGALMSPRTTGTLDLQGVTLRNPCFVIPLVGSGGDAVFSGDEVLVHEARFLLDRHELKIAGKICQLISGGEIQNLVVQGPLVLAHLSTWGGPTPTGIAQIDAQGHGPLHAPSLEGTLSASTPVLRTGGGGIIKGAGLRVRFVRTGVTTNATLQQGSVHGGVLSGSARLTDGKPLEFDLAVDGADLAALLTGLGVGGIQLGGQVKAKLRGTASKGEVVATGSAVVRNLAIDLSKSMGLSALRQKLPEGGITGAGVDLISSGVGFVFRNLDRVLPSATARISGMNRLGRVEADLTVKKDEFRIDPIRGANVAGWISVSLPSGKLSGRLAPVTLGRVRMKTVDISGSLSSPRLDTDVQAVTVDGRQSEGSQERTPSDDGEPVPPPSNQTHSKSPEPTPTPSVQETSGANGSGQAPDDRASPAVEEPPRVRSEPTATAGTAESIPKKKTKKSSGSKKKTGERSPADLLLIPVKVGTQILDEMLQSEPSDGSQ